MLAEGRGVPSPDPVEAHAWLSLAVENGQSPAARDSLALRLDSRQLAAAAARLTELQRGRSSPPDTPAGDPSGAELARLREEIGKLRLELDAARLDQAAAERHAASLEAQLQAVQGVQAK
jgi:TPR repeat protein